MESHKAKRLRARMRKSLKKETRRQADGFFKSIFQMRFWARARVAWMILKGGY